MYVDQIQTNDTKYVPRKTTMKSDPNPDIIEVKKKKKIKMKYRRYSVCLGNGIF